MKIRIICAALAVMLLAFTACGPNAQPSNMPEENQILSEAEAALNGAEKTERLNEVVADEKPTATDEIGPEPTDTDAIAEDAAAAADETAESKAEINAPVGGSIAQIVEFYNSYANGVKAADNITIQKHDLREAAIELPALLKALTARGRSGSLNPDKNETTTEIFVNGKGTRNSASTLNDFLPVRGKAIVSELKSSSVKSANCVIHDDGWIVTINLKDEPFDMNEVRRKALYPENMTEEGKAELINDMILKTGYGSCMDIAFADSLQYADQSTSPNLPANAAPGAVSTAASAASDATSNISSIAAVGSIEGTFKNGVITAAFDRHGQLTSLTLSYDDDMNIGVRGMKIKINSSSKQEYQFTW